VSEVKNLLAEAERSGNWRIVPTRDGWRLENADGFTLVHVHRTSSDHRAMVNLRSLLRF